MREPLKLKALDCESFETTILISEKDFLREAFIKALPDEVTATVFKQRNFLEVSCNRSNKKIDYRARVNFHKAEGKDNSPEMHFHIALIPTSAMKRTDEQPPFAEGIFQWVQQFIVAEAEIGLRESAEFSFSGAQYRSVFSLPSVLAGPLNPTGSDVFEGSRMIGLALRPQSNKAGVTLTAQTVTKKSLRVNVRREVETSAQKLLSIESDVAILHTVALSTVKLTKEEKQ